MPKSDNGERTSGEGNLNRSKSVYSLVSCSELTPGSLEVWLELPDEIKYDPALANFKQLYEKQYGKLPPPTQETTEAVALLPQGQSSGSKFNGGSRPAVEDAIDDLHVGYSGHHGDEGLHGSTGHHSDKHETKFDKAMFLIKMSALLLVWFTFTAILMLKNEKEAVVLHSYVAPTETKNYLLTNTHHSHPRVQVHLTGPFKREDSRKRVGDTSRSLEVWLERWTVRNDGINGSVDDLDIQYRVDSPRWTIKLLADELIDFSLGLTHRQVLSLPASNASALPRNVTSGTQIYVLRMKSNATRIVPLKMSYTQNPLDMTQGVIYAALLLTGLYVLIIFEIVNRTFAALLTSTMSIAVLALVGERPSMPELVSWIDVETLLLLFSMMLLVAILAETGAFDYFAVLAFKMTGGRIWPLINCLCFITALLSSFLDNVTTVLLMTPVTIRLCEVMELNPIPVLMMTVIYSNVGGTATPVGDPPNVIIASNGAVIKAGINFTTFTFHMTLGIVLVCVQTYLQLRFMYRDMNKLRHSETREVQAIKQELSVWRRAAASLASYSGDESLVRAALERKVSRLAGKLTATRATSKQSSAVDNDTFQQTLKELEKKYFIRDRVLLIKATISITFVVVVFFLHSLPELQRLSLGWTALLGAILLLILYDKEDLEPVIARVEWSTLLFFAALFILMEALSKLGLIEWIGNLTEDLILSVGEGQRLAVAIILILWVSAIVSAFVDNIPLTTMMVRVATDLGNNPALGLPMSPLIWALAFGACLGGNGTLIGASANVVCAGVAEQHGYRFTFMDFFKLGFPVMLGHIIVITAYLLVSHCLFEWH